MSAAFTPALRRIAHRDVTITGGFWLRPVEVNRNATLPYQYERCRDTGRFDSLKLAWKPGDEPVPHHFWDSDVAKWIEAAGYSLATHPDSDLEARVDGVIDMVAAAQEEDGYLNSYFQQVCPEKRWTNLRDMHELYCAGHMMEAAVAYFDATGKRKLLEVMERYARHIDSHFGPEPGKKRGYPGHEEIELALVKLYRATGEESFLRLAKFFVDERGSEPHYFELEAKARGDEPSHRHSQFCPKGAPFDYWQAHLPVRKQDSAEGHSVRACYLYTGMAGVAAETGDRELFEACKRIWDNIVDKRMYVTGGIGSHKVGERFTLDYDLPNEEAYSETCAAISLVFFAKRMLDIGADGRYADVMELALYNTVLGGVSMDGKRFFYANPLAVNPTSLRLPQVRADLERQEWYDCACCPPNVARLLASLGEYVASSSDAGPSGAGQSGDPGLYVHLYLDCRMHVSLGGVNTKLQMETSYPWDEDVRISVTPDRPCSFDLALRIPAWCRDAEIRVQGSAVDVGAVMRNGYALLSREWQPGDTVEIHLPLPPRRVYAHPEVRSCSGRFAYMRGPLVYCLEEVDNGANLHAAQIPAGEEARVVPSPDLLDGCVALEAAGQVFDTEGVYHLYGESASKGREGRLRLIPYALRANRACGEMVVWIRE